MRSDAEFDRYAQDYGQMLRIPARDGFVRSGEFYHRRKWELIVDFLRSRSLSPAKMSWLDVGCGKAELLGFGRGRFRQVSGCDPSREMTRDARDLEIRLQENPVVLPYSSGTFDFATAVCVYHHVAEPDRMPLTREIHRVLRPGGIFCMIEHNPINPVTRLIVNRCPFDVDAHLLTGGAAKAYAAEAGLRTVDLQYFLYLPEAVYDKAGGLERLGRKIPLGGQYALFTAKS